MTSIALKLFTVARLIATIVALWMAIYFAFVSAAKGNWTEGCFWMLFLILLQIRERDE